MIRPIMFLWTEDEIMAPLGRMLPLARRQYAIGETYALGPVENIAGSSRAPLFIAVKNAWNSLPEDDKRFPTEEHLRKRALVAAGWATHRQVVMNTPEDAMKMVAAARALDAYAVITVKENVVDIWVAKSIGAGQITAEEWKVVKPRALDFVAEQINTTRTELERNSKRDSK